MDNYDGIYRFLQPTDTMERVSKDRLISEFDKIMESVIKGNKGVIVVNENKEDELVVCPAKWFNFMFDEDFGCIINSALRYAITRRTYMPEVVVRFMKRYIDVLDGRTLCVAIRDIERELQEGNIEEPAMWIELKNSLKTRLEEIETEGAKD